MRWIETYFMFDKYSNLIGPLDYVATLYTTKNSSGKMKKCPVVVSWDFKKPIDIWISKESEWKIITTTSGLYCNSVANKE